MGRASVRAAVTSYLTEAELGFVGVVHSARPEIIEESDYETSRLNEAVSSENGSSAVLVVNIPDDKRQRRADTGRGAVNDSWTHSIVIEVFFASVGGDAIAAQTDYDVVVDEITNLIRANATLSAPSAIWSAGEYTVGIQHQQSAPYNDAEGLAVFISGAVMFEAWEWVAGNV